MLTHSAKLVEPNITSRANSIINAEQSGTKQKQPQCQTFVKNVCENQHSGGCHSTPQQYSWGFWLLIF